MRPARARASHAHGLHQASAELPSVLRALLGPVGVLAAKLSQRHSQRGGSAAAAALTTEVRVLAGCHGHLAPGTLTLLLAPPGHGKSSLLRALAGHIAPSSLSGPGIRYGGVPAAELPARGVNVRLLAAYVAQHDAHLAFLTVRETVTFAAALSTVEPALMGHPLLVAAAAERTERVLKLLHLTGCAATLLGGGAVRGVSGGERKRVTVAEALVSNARLLCMDEISTGLDASVTFDIVASIRAWARAMRGTVIIALQQPTPEVYNLFDGVVLLREGATLFHGAREALPDYTARMGFFAPAGSDSADMADWLIELLTSPTALRRRRRSVGGSGAAADSAPLTTALMAASWREEAPGGGKDGAALAAADVPADDGLALASPFAQRQYGRAYPRPALSTFGALLRRQGILSARNTTVLAARATSACVSSLVLGIVWLNLGVEQGGAKLGLFVYALAQIAFANFPEITYCVEWKFVAFKQVRAGMYPAWGVHRGCDCAAAAAGRRGERCFQPHPLFYG
jgi:ABC-type multidrug transport system ATPase subunit